MKKLLISAGCIGLVLAGNMLGNAGFTTLARTDNALGKEEPTPALEAPAKPTPKTLDLKADLANSTSTQDCLKRAGFTYEVDPDSPDYIHVADADEREIALLTRNYTAADAQDLADIDNEMREEEAAQAESDGWEVGHPSEDSSIAIGKYVVDYSMDVDDPASKVVTDCMTEFES